MDVSSGGAIVAGRFRPHGGRLGDAAPFKLYLPRSRSDVVTAVREARVLGQRLTVRGAGDRPEECASAPGIVLSTERLDRILSLHPGARTVTVEPGVLVHKLDEYLAGHSFGLAVGCSEPMRSVGSFAALGGVGPSSHQSGLFVDHVLAVEQVGSDLRARTYRREGGASLARQLRQGYGVPTKITLALVPVDKQRLSLGRTARYFVRPSEFVLAAGRQLRSASTARLQSARFVDVPLGREALTLGTVRWWHERERRTSRVRTDAERGAGALLAEALPQLSGRFGDALATLSLLTPRRASCARAEREGASLARVTAGTTRSYRLIVPEARFEAAFWALYGRALRERREHGAIGAITLDVARVRTPSLGESHVEHCALRLTLGLAGHELGDRLAGFGAQLDGLCTTHAGSRLTLPTVSFAGH